MLCNKQLAGLGFLWGLLWLSLNAESGIQRGEVLSSIHGIRVFFPYAAAIISIVWVCCLRVLPTIQLWQIGIIGFAGVVLFAGGIAGSSLSNLHFHSSMLCAVVVTVLGGTLARQKNIMLVERDVIVLFGGISLIFLSLVLGVFFFRDLFQAFNHGILDGYRIQPNAPNQFGMAAPRPTGIARSAAILTLALLFGYWSGALRSKIFVCAACMTSAIMLFYQARGTYVSFCIALLLTWYLLPKLQRPSFKETIFYLVCSVFFLLLIWITILFAILISDIGPSNQSNLSGPIRDFIPDSFTSGRFGHWRNGISVFLTSPIYGLGGQADRLWIDHNVSNIIIYSLMCGGVLGCAFGFLALARSVLCIGRIYSEKIALKEPDSGILLIAISVFTFLSARGIFENSYALFNIDFLLALPAIWYLDSRLQRKKS